MTTWQQIPGILINLVFATLFLGVLITGVRQLWSQGGSQLCYGMIIGSGQYITATAPFINISMGIWWSIALAGIVMVAFFILSWLNGWVQFKPSRLSK